MLVILLSETEIIFPFKKKKTYMLLTACKPNHILEPYILKPLNKMDTKPQAQFRMNYLVWPIYCD